MINTAINQLITFALQKNMILEEDANYSINLLVDLFKLNHFEKEVVEEVSLYDILDTMLDYAVHNGIIEDTTTNRDLFDTRIMNCIMPRPSEVIGKFNSLFEKDSSKATDYFYDLSINSNYIRKSRTDKNIKFSHFYKYGDIQISINLSKPEKDPKEIAKAKLIKSSGYPKCLLCKENVGYSGNLNHPARQTHRIIPIHLNDKKFYLQYSPYVYYDEHCIVLNEDHVPMKMNRKTIENLFSFVNQFPHYMIGSNADLPIVGGSILTHDHYQGGRHHFPMEDAKIVHEYMIKNTSIKAQILNWPLSTLRLTSKNDKELIDFAELVLNKWIDSRKKSPKELYNALKSFVTYLEDVEYLCKSKGECYEFWFREILTTPDYITKRKNELNELSQNLEALQRQYEKKKSELLSLDSRITKALIENDGILQSDFIKKFDPLIENEVREKLYYLSKEGKLQRIKTGRSYTLHYNSK